MRPTPQRVRESLFSILGARVEGARVLDLYAGSGGLGLECLSRGAESAVFVERDRDVLSVLRENVEAARAQGCCHLLACDVLRGIGQLAAQGRVFDVVLLDPPYGQGRVGPTLAALVEHGLVAPSGVVVIDHPSDEEPEARIGEVLELTDRRVYGDTAIAFYESPDEESRSTIMPRIAIYPGSFDPVTHGHLNIIRRALEVFDRLIVGVLDNSKKTALFTVEERIEQIRRATGDDPRIDIDHFAGLLVDFAEKKGATVLLRGLRAVSDFDYEFQMAHMNRKLRPEMETMFMMTGEEFFYVSSRLVKEIAALGGDVGGLVPDFVVAELALKFPRIPK